MNDELTPTAFREAWLKIETTAKLVVFGDAALRACGVDDAGVQFLVEAGLPSWATPHMHFSFDGEDALPPPVDPDDKPVTGLPVGAGEIGSTGEDWPIWFALEHPGQLFCRTLENVPRTLLLNTSASKLAASLLVFALAADEALAWGDKHGERDAWLRQVYPAGINDRVRTALTEIDGPAMRDGSYWHGVLCDFDSERARFRGSTTDAQ